MWQYPPGAAAVIGAPHFLHVSYAFGLLTLILAADLAITALLVRSSKSLTGAWMWVAALTLVGPVAIVRFDMVPALCAVIALVVQARPLIAGAALAVGGLVKVWPLALLPSLPTARLRATLTAGIVVIASVAAVAAWGPEGWAGFLHGQRARGLQIESVPATPFVFLHALGVGTGSTLAYGAQQVTMPGAGAVATLAKVVTGLLLLGIIWGARSRSLRSVDPALFALATVLVILVASPVLSSQYIVWPLAVGAVVVARRGVSRSWIALLGAAALTQVLYPALYDNLLLGGLAGAVDLLIRNVLLVMATVLCVRDVWRSGQSAVQQ
jgi:hypothetical protein